MPPVASIIIPTRNRPADLRRCLSRLLAQLPADGSVDLHVGDDSDGAETETLLNAEFPMVGHHRGSRGGPGANRNACVQRVGGHWLIFVDDDCLPQADFLAGYLAAFALAGPAARMVLAGPILRSDENKDSLLWEAPHSAAQHDLPPSCNFALPRALFLEAGGFDERFRISFEDMELFARLGLLGVPVRFVGAAGVEHPSRPLPAPARLALRWEARVISTLDLGASPGQVLWRLPRHIILVVLSRFRGRKPSFENLRAAGIFFSEFLIALGHLPAWLWKYQKGPRSPFWVEQVGRGNGPARFGL